MRRVGERRQQGHFGSGRRQKTSGVIWRGADKDIRTLTFGSKHMAKRRRLYTPSTPACHERCPAELQKHARHRHAVLQVSVCHNRCFVDSNTEQRCVCCRAVLCLRPSARRWPPTQEASIGRNFIMATVQRIIYVALTNSSETRPSVLLASARKRQFEEGCCLRRPSVAEARRGFFQACKVHLVCQKKD